MTPLANIFASMVIAMIGALVVVIVVAALV